MGLPTLWRPVGAAATAAMMKIILVVLDGSRDGDRDGAIALNPGKRGLEVALKFQPRCFRKPLLLFSLPWFTLQ